MYLLALTNKLAFTFQYKDHLSSGLKNCFNGLDLKLCQEARCSLLFIAYALHRKKLKYAYMAFKVIKKKKNTLHNDILKCDANYHIAEA